ncbi:MAG: mechanosensitive ion channel family protein [Symploca sp. SIO3C6]|uniref:Mechanosensitive ion channel family protein n=1 Tax=Symploca sp. SIO1C4 TaxID=2607765 RepID=A0A6B3NB10_9CYAN|nr:mechanosensitive ion channel family protein [Symploca sp. SIO3C6]NER28770.1 mechanosensitive ion channel family protein [Symploca sp. SIO1C4]
MLQFLLPLLLADSISDTSLETAENTQELIAEITTWKITQALLVLGVAYLGILIIDKSISWLSERVDREWRLGIKQSLPFLRTLVLTIAVVILLNLFVDLSPNNVLALTGTVSVALGFAFKDYASSVIAGLIALFENPYRVGDRVQIEEHYGEVTSYGLRGIRMQTPEDNLVSIPHNKIWTTAISNANTGQLEAQVVTQFHLAHEIDVELVIRILERVAYTSKYTQLKLPILVLVEEKPWGKLFELKSYPMDAREEFIYKTDLIKRANRVFAKYHLTYPRILSQTLDSQ